MPQLILIFYLIHFTFLSPPLYISRNVENNVYLVKNNSSGDIYCEMVKELYMIADLYLEKAAHIESKNSVVKEIFINLIHLVWDNTSDKMKSNTSNFEKNSSKTIEYLVRTLGVTNPLDFSDWFEIIFILIAQVGKRVDKNGSTCLRPSQSAMILFSLLQKESLDDDRRQRLINIYINNLQYNYNYSSDLKDAIENLFSKENDYQKYKNSIFIQKHDKIQKLMVEINSLLLKQKQKLERDYQTTDKYFDFLIREINVSIDQYYQIMENFIEGYFQKMIFVLTNKKSRVFLNSESQRINFIHNNLPYYDQVRVNYKNIKKPEFINDTGDKNEIFNNVLNYILLEKYFIDNPNKERGIRDLEIINEEKSKLDTQILSTLEVNFTTVYTLTKKQFNQYQQLLFKVKSMQQQIPIKQLKQYFDMNNEDSQKALSLFFELPSSMKSNDLIIYQKWQNEFQNDHQKNYFEQKFLLDIQFQQMQIFLYESYEDNNDYVTIFYEVFQQNFQLLNREQKTYYFDYFLLYHYRVFSDEVPIQFISQIQTKMESENKPEVIQQFKELYFTMLLIDRYTFNENFMQDKEKWYIRRRMLNKMGNVINIVGYVSYLTIKTLTSWIYKLGLDVLFCLIPKEDIKDYLSNMRIFQSIDNGITHVRDYLRGDILNDQFTNMLSQLNDIKLTTKEQLKKKKVYNINLKRNLYLLNEESFKSFEAQILWNNLKPKTKGYIYI